MSKNVRIYRTLVGLLFFLMVVLQTGCGPTVNSQDEITITTQSKEARKLYLEGRELLDHGRVDESRVLFSKAIEADADFALAYLTCAFIATSTADLQKHLDKAVALAPHVSKGERLLIEAYQAIVDNNYGKADTLCKQLVQKFPDDKRAHDTRGNFYFWQNEPDKAIAEYEKVIEIDKDYAKGYNLLGYIYIQKEEYEKAEEAFKNYIRLIPDEANPHDSIADLYTRMGRHEDAIEHFKMSVKLDPTFYLSQQKIGTNLVFLGKYEKGRKAFRKAMEMESPPNAKITDMNQIALSYIYEGNFEQAVAAYDASLKMAEEARLADRVAEIHSQKCAIFSESGQLSKAEKSLAACKKTVMASDLRKSFKNIFIKDALAQEALIAAKKDDFKTAMAKADEQLAMIQADNNPNEMEDYHGLVGLIYFEKGDYAKAIEHLNQGDQQSAYILYHRAISKSKAGNQTRAAELFQKVVVMNQYSLNDALVRSKAMAAL